MAEKSITVTFYKQNHVRKDWEVDLTSSHIELFFLELAHDLSRFGVQLEWLHNETVVIDINSYADVLNAVRIASPADGFTNICVGHVIDKSPNLDIFEDVKRAVNRMAFAPETVAPDGENRRTCHNCGCGC